MPFLITVARPSVSFITAYCDVKLIAPDGTVISHCEAHAANPQAAERLRYQAKQNSVAWKIGKLYFSFVGEHDAPSKH